ncbi:MAG: hypothetical protein LBE62_02315 [Azonexus sp.]|jgi:hypothetical protein|nr:hypothetical protein [Azonexus sp.]
MALPPMIKAIADLIGYGLAMNLVRELGGQDFRFPAAAGGAAWEALVEIVGPQAAEKLVGRFRGEEVYIALCEQSIKDEQRQKMIGRYEALLKAGHSGRGAVSVLVREFRPISNRTVEKIVNGPLPETIPGLAAQGSLF